MTDPRETGPHGPRAVRFNGPGWYVLDDSDEITDGPFATREAAEQVIAQQYPPPRR
ncbi:hypothetical protein LPC08_07965 [Roseomonas sp. OT10]|uniref:hypothetical protein n=1 Tax=Roseomonas cutis TaxID=2897332 RepID=UPI001E65BF36|nr:hypothetical protein [Roseomonas sp. OT10]UFN50541.1 hypothetical protein LPC08_07965 [Roseomonas sp. OT10]